MLKNIVHRPPVDTRTLHSDDDRAVTLIVPDADGDAIPDEWEVSVFGNITTMNETSDWDKDGYTDLQEYHNILNGETDPEGAAYDPKTVNAPGGTGYVSSSSAFWSYMLPVIINSIEKK